MPRGDRTGPLGRGAMTGRGLGLCSGVQFMCRGAGLGLGLMAAKRGLRNKILRRGAGIGLGLCRGPGFGFRGGITAEPMNDENRTKRQKELLEEEKARLESRLRVLNKQLGDFSELNDLT